MNKKQKMFNLIARAVHELKELGLDEDSAVTSILVGLKSCDAADVMNLSILPVLLETLVELKKEERAADLN